MRIIYVDIDSCRPDHLSGYGYRRPTSPAIDTLAHEGVRFANCYASDTPCMPSRAALFSGRLGIRNGVTTHFGPGHHFRSPSDGDWRGPAIPMLMEVLQRAGWHTASFSSFARRHRAWWFTAGFTEFYGHRFLGGSESAEQVNEHVLSWLKRRGTEDNWFLHVNYWDAHTPYEAPDRLLKRMAAFPPPSFPDSTALQIDRERYYGPQTARDQWFNDPGEPETHHPRMVDDIATFDQFEQLLNGYDAGIAYADEAVGQILETLQSLGVRDETAVIVSSDHGEAIGELGMYLEHGNASEGVTRVPLIISWPGATTGARSEALAYQLDLGPTILDLLGLPVPDGWDGESIAAALRGEEFGGREFIVRGCGIYSFQRAIRQGDWLLIQTLHSGLYPLDPVYLFNLREDPQEGVNLAESHPSKRLELQGLLAEWWSRHCTGPNSVRDPFQLTMEAGPDQYYPASKLIARLRAMGRDDHLHDLRRRRPDLAIE